MAKITQLVKRTGAVVPFKKERITNAIYRAAVAVGGRDRSIAEGLANQVVAILEEITLPGHIPTVEEIQDIVEKVLIENGHAKTAKAYILYRDERARRRRERAERSAHPSKNIPWHKLWEVLNWAVEHHLHTVECLNARIARGEFPEIVRETDRAYNEDITTASEMIGERRDKVRMVIVAGPSSSGKTTTTIKLSHLLTKMGLNLVPLTVDNYFFDLELHPKDEHGDYDFETPQALDLALINEHLARLIAGEGVRIPFYDFKTGQRHDAQTPMRVGPNDIILIDSLHGLYADMTRSVDDELKFKLYIEPLLQMKGPDGKFVRWTDLRLMRRMVRDALHRAYKPQQTLEHWHYVRSSEMRNIIPYISATDYIVNSGLPYELPIMRAKLFDHFEKWVAQYKGDPLREDAFMRAERVYHLLKAVTPVEDESAIPPDSLLREFIGGSCYEYSCASPLSVRGLCHSDLDNLLRKGIIAAKPCKGQKLERGGRMKVLVTGGAGFIGSHVVDTLIGLGHEVTVVDDLSTGKREHLNPDAKFYPLDICDAQGLEEVFAAERPEIVNHQAARANVRESMEEPVLYAEVNIIGSLNLLESSRKYGIEKFIYASTGGAVYGEPEYLPADESHPINPLDPYGASKHFVEHYLYLYGVNYGLSYTTLRYPNVYGPRQDPHGEAGVVAIFTGQMLQEGRPVINGSGEQERDFVYVGDIVEANIQAMKRGDNQIYNLGWGVGISINEIFARLKEITGYGKEAVHGPPKLGEVFKIYLEASKAQRELGWVPRVGLDEGMRMTVEYFRNANRV